LLKTEVIYGKASTYAVRKT